jgi:hypothetical protein
MRDLNQRILSDLLISYFRQEDKYYVNISKYITKDTTHRAVKLKGLPFSATEEDIIDFFGNFNLV